MQKHLVLRLLAVLLGFTLVATACGDDDSDSGEAAEREAGRLRRVTPPATALNVEREV